MFPQIIVVWLKSLSHCSHSKGCKEGLELWCPGREIIFGAAAAPPWVSSRHGQSGGGAGGGRLLGDGREF